MKKVLAMLLAIVMMVALVGCGANENDANTHDDSNTSETMSQESVRVDEGETSETTLPTEVETTPLFVCEYDTSRFYYDQLTDDEKEVYELIDAKAEDFMSNTPVCLISMMGEWPYEGDNRYIADRALEAYTLDNPLSSIWLADTGIVYWVDISFPEDGDYIIHEKGYYVAPYGQDYIDGVFDYVTVSGETAEQKIAEVKQMIAEVEQTTHEFVETLSGTDAEMIEQINEWIFDGCEYTLETDHIRDLYGCIIEKRSCCAGDAMAIKYVADQAGLNAIVVTGLGIYGEKSVEEVKAEYDAQGMEYVNHAWNQVFTSDRGWTLMDGTWGRAYCMVPTGVYEDLYTPDGEYLGYGETLELKVVASDAWLFLELDSEKVTTTHILYERFEFKYPK